VQAMNLAMLPDACFPPAEATNKLASLRAKGVKAKVAAPFPLMDLAEFLPSWADDTDPYFDEADVSAPLLARASKKGKLDMVRWIAAFQAYALAADAAEVCTLCAVPVHCGSLAYVCCQVWKYASAMAHLNVCLEIAAGAAAEKKRYSLAIVYDELCRKEWHLKASRGKLPVAQISADCGISACAFVRAGDRQFDVNYASLHRDTALLERARTAFLKESESFKGEQHSVCHCFKRAALLHCV
jgi:hypothetical protein